MGMPAEVDATTVRVTTRSGAVEVVADPEHTVVRAEGGTSRQDGSVTTITSAGARVRMRVPSGTDLVIGSTSGRVDLRGPLGSVSVLTSSGSVRIDDAASVDARSTSGRITIGQVVGECRASTVSGRVEVERCGAAHVTTRSGRVQLRGIHGAAHVHCVSGRIDLVLAGAFDVDAETVSGRIAVSLPRGVEPLVVSTPRDQDAFPVGAHDCVVRARSVSGRVVVENR
jgi:DUF4097 and DUF4098 domain-containing protein YvlB